MSLTAEDWPITAAVLQFPSVTTAGVPIQDAAPEEWVAVFREVADAGFANVDLTDSWVRPGDLSPSRLDELKQAADEAGVGAPVISAIRRSVIQKGKEAEHLAYAHRTLDSAAALGIGTVSFGLHQALTAEQQKQLWFWTVEGHKDPVGDDETWGRAVTSLRELGTHAAELGIIISLEMYEDTYIGSGDSTVRLIEDIGLANVGVNPDVGNLIRLHRPIEDWREVFHKVLPYANYWHMKNYSRDEDEARGYYIAFPAPMESGLISYREVFAEALSFGFQGILCMEHYGGDGLSVSASNQAYLRNRILPKSPDYALGTSRATQQTAFTGR